MILKLIIIPIVYWSLFLISVDMLNRVISGKILSFKGILELLFVSLFLTVLVLNLYSLLNEINELLLTINFDIPCVIILFSLIVYILVIFVIVPLAVMLRSKKN